MNGLDIFLIVLGGYTFLRGIFRGLVREAASICGLILGFWLAHNSYPLAAEPLQRIIPAQEYAEIVAYACLFMLALLFFLLLGIGLQRLLQALLLGWLDRLAGALLGLAKGLILACLVFLGLGFFLPQDSTLLTESRLAPYLVLVLHKLESVLPQNLHEF
ncbi:MAG: CvpA family protein, partial [Desulfohalobiaceae bacterium]